MGHWKCSSIMEVRGQLWEVSSYPPPVSSGDLTLFWLGSRYLYPLSHLASPSAVLWSSQHLTITRQRVEDADSEHKEHLISISYNASENRRDKVAL